LRDFKEINVVEIAHMPFSSTITEISPGLEKQASYKYFMYVIHIGGLNLLDFVTSNKNVQVELD